MSFKRPAITTTSKAVITCSILVLLPSVGFSQESLVAISNPIETAYQGYYQQLNGKRVDVEWSMRDDGDLTTRWSRTSDESLASTSGKMMLSTRQGYRMQLQTPSLTFDMRLETPNTVTSLFSRDPAAEKTKTSQPLGRVSTLDSHMMALMDCFWPAKIFYERHFNFMTFGKDTVEPTVDGRFVLKTVSDNGVTKTIFDDQDGFQIYSYEFKSETNGYHSSSKREYSNEKIDGIWIPVKCSSTLTYENTNASENRIRKLETTWTARSSKIQSDSSNTPLAWEFSFPIGTRVVDNKNGRNYTVGGEVPVERVVTDETAKKLNEFMTLKESGDLESLPTVGNYSRSSNSWLYGIVVTLGFTALLITYKRFRKKRS